MKDYNKKIKFDIKIKQYQRTDYLLYKHLNLYDKSFNVFKIKIRDIWKWHDYKYNIYDLKFLKRVI